MELTIETKLYEAWWDIGQKAAGKYFLNFCAYKRDIVKKITEEDCNGIKKIYVLSSGTELELLQIDNDRLWQASQKNPFAAPAGVFFTKKGEKAAVFFTEVEAVTFAKENAILKAEEEIKENMEKVKNCTEEIEKLQFLLAEEIGNGTNGSI